MLQRWTLAMAALWRRGVVCLSSALRSSELFIMLIFLQFEIWIRLTIKEKQRL